MTVIAELNRSFAMARRVGLALLLSAAALCNPTHGQTTAYFADAIWTGDGSPVRDAALIVRDGKVVSVGARDDVEIPRNARRVELGAANLIPGLVVAQTNLVESTRADEYSVSPEVRAVDGFDPFEDYHDLLAAGITTVQISPASNRLVPGQGAVVKLGGEESLQKVLLESESLRFVLTREGLSPPTVYEPPVGAVSVERPVEPTKPQLATSLSQAVVGLNALFSVARSGDADGNVSLATLAELLGNGTVSRWTANGNAEIQAALKIATEYNLPWIVVDPVDIDVLASRSVWKSELARGVVLNPELRPGLITNPNANTSGQKPELPVWQRARKLFDAGAGDRLAIRTTSDRDLEKLLYVASVLGRSGLSTAQILKTITSNPARIMGVDDRVGILQPGADADFVVLSGKPFDRGTKLLATYTDGKSVFEREAKNETASVIRASSIYTADGVVSGGSVTVSGGKIAGLGNDVSLPKGAEVKDFGDAVIIPGMIDCSTSLGFGATYSSAAGLGTKLGGLLGRDDDQVARGRQGGVTTGLVSSSRLPSPVLAFKLSDSPRPLKDPVALRYDINGNLTAAEQRLESVLKAGKGYADAWTKYDAAYAQYKKQLAEYEAAKKKYDAAVKAAEAKKAAAAKKAEEEKKKAEAAKKSGASPKSSEADKKENDKDSDKAEEEKDSDGKDSDEKDSAKEDSEKKSDSKSGDEPKLVAPKKPTEPKKPRASSNLEPYRAVFAKKLPVLIEVSDVKELELAVNIFRKKYGLKTGIVAGQAAAARAKLLAENEVFVIVGPTFVSTDEDGQLLNIPAELAVGGADLAFQSKASTGTSELPTAISYAVYEGLGASDALAGLTHSPAQFFNLDSVGAIATGNDADLVVLSGPPMLLSTEVLAVMIDGKWVYEKESN